MEYVKLLGMDLLSKREVKKNDAVMFDIDETLIFFEDSSPNKPMIELCKHAGEQGYEVIIITARPFTTQNNRLTIEELRYHDINYDMLVYATHHNKSLTKLKLKRNFVLSIGDLWTDLGETEHWIKLPGNGEPGFKTSIVCHN